MLTLRRLTVTFLAAFGGATAITGYVTYTASQAAICQLVDQRIDAVSSALLDESRPGDARSIVARMRVLSQRRETGDIGFALLDAAGRRLGGNVALDRAVPPGFSGVRHLDGILGLTHGRVLSRPAGGGLTLLTIAETEPIDGYAAVRLRNYVVSFGSIALIVLAGLGAFSLIVRRRIGEVRRTAAAIIDGDLSRRLPVDPRGGMFAAQAETFNRMLDRIGTLVEGLRNVSSDVAHDMRTPLSRLRGHIARGVEAAPTPELAAELEEALDQCDALLQMFSAILRITEVEGGDRRAAFRHLDLAELARELVDTMAAAAEEGGRQLRLGALVPVMVEGDLQLLSQAMLNLIENALTHSPPGSTVTVEVGADRPGEGGHVALRVIDDGPGIAASDRARALRRFGRLDASRNRPGHGLGLPLADAVARMHRGTLRLEDAGVARDGGRGPGLAVSIRLPLAD